MSELTSDRLVGPLKEIRKKPFIINDFIDLDQLSIGFIGDTKSGKTQMIKALTYCLGGVYQEKKNYCNCTLKDSSYIFAEKVIKGRTKTYAIHFRSHKLYNDISESEKNIVVIGKWKTMHLSRQLNNISSVMKSKNISYSDCIALITRTNSSEDLSKRRKNKIDTLGFKDIYFTNNPKKRNYSINDLNISNIDSVLNLLRDDNPTMKLIYFGSETLPKQLEEKVVLFDKHLTFKDWKKEKPTEKSNAHEELLQSIYGTDYDAIAF